MNKNKKDYLLHTLLFQFLICAVTFGILFGIKSTGSGALDNLKDAYFDNLERNFIVEVKESGVEAFKNVEKEEDTDATTPMITEATEITTNKATEQPITKKLVSELSATIKASGGADYSVSNKDDIPDNVSVDSYTLNRKMFMPAAGEITSPFGIRNHPIDGELRFHAGVDIANDTGTPIYAAFDGVISVSDYDSWNGYYLKITHDNNIMTVYCHCSKLLVKKGETVKAGQKIAEMGSTGSSTGPHLHFEFRINNVSYDPEGALSEAISGI